MGMAASQARFLSLTARKSNVEYEGQQINQERTALANESSNLYAQLTKLDVPTPPNTSDFYKPVYTFKAKEFTGATEQFTLDEIYTTPEGTFAKITHNESVFGAYTNPRNAGTISASTFEKPSSNATGLQIVVGEGVTAKAFEIKYDPIKYDSNNKNATLEYLRSENSSFEPYKVGTADTLAYFEKDGKKYYLTASELDTSMGDNYAAGPLSVEPYQKPDTKEYKLDSYETNEIGRTTSITVRFSDQKNDVKTYELDCVSVEDEEAYNQAMLDYEYYQAKYEKQVADINAKTEAIQQKDKSLELELKQLDTEQNAIKTEMDAVQKVVEDNVESTFKTFA